MASSNRRWPLACVLTALAGAGVLWAQDQAPAGGVAAAEREARLTQVDGTVYIHLHDQDDDQFVRAQADAGVETGDMIRTGDDGSTELTLDGQSVIEINPNSDFIVNSLAPERTEFYVGIGSILAKIKHLVEGESMEYRTPTAVASVRGTELGVSQEPGDQVAHVGVFDEGKVSVSLPTGGQPTQIGPGQEVALQKGRPLGQPTALKQFANSSKRMAFTRTRVAQVSKGWAPRTAAARQAIRGQLRSNPAMKGSQLNHISPNMQNRRYNALKARQQALSRGHQQNQGQGGQQSNRRVHVRPRQPNQKQGQPTPQNRQQQQPRQHQQGQQQQQQRQQNQQQSERQKQQRQQKQQQNEQQKQQQQQRRQQQQQQREQERQQRQQQRQQAAEQRKQAQQLKKQQPQNNKKKLALPGKHPHLPRP
jgi:hypothetical protein